jgi:hypothetical protein
MTLSSLPVELLFRMEATIGSTTWVSPGPQGDRLVLGVAGGSFSGPRLEGTLLAGPGSEWATRRPDGSVKADVRLVLETSDGAHILMTYNGIASGAGGESRVTTAPLFETGDERYAWLNGIQAIALGAPIEGGVGYDVYQVL